MAKARTDEASERRLTTLQLRRLNFRSVPVAVWWDSDPGSGPPRRTGVGWSRAVGRDSPHKVEYMAVEPAGPQPLGKGWPVRLSAGSASACSATTDERSGQPARTPTPAGTATDHADIVRFRERMPTVERQRTVALARPAAVASDRERRASSTARSEVGSAAAAGAIPADVARSSGSNPSPPAAAAVTSRFRHRPPSFGREHGRRVRRRASPLPPGLGRFAAAGGRRATRPLPNARPRRLGGRDLRPGARASQGRRLVTRCGRLYPGMGIV
jgi:hypothetical protein